MCENVSDEINEETLSLERQFNELLQKTFESKAHVFDSSMTKEERNKKFDELFGW
ncbi:hypothetical protein K6L09_20955 [Burkholderia cepacia]